MSKIDPVRSRVSTNSTATTLHTFSYPAEVDAGDTLVAFVGADGAAVPAVPTGWTDLGLRQVANANGRAFYKKAAGTEGGGTFDVSTSASEEANCYVWAIEGLDPDSDPPEAAATDSSVFGTSTLTAPMLTPSGGSRPYLWLVASSGDNGRTASGWPAANFYNWHQSRVSSGTVALYACERALEAASVTPGQFGTPSSAIFWVAFTIAVPIGAITDSTVVCESQAVTVSAQSTTHTINYPTGIEAGDTLLAEVVTWANQTPTFPAGWTMLDSAVNDNPVTVSLWEKSADGTESGTFAITLGEARTGVATVRRFSGVSDIEAQMVVAGAGTDFPNPPSLTPTFGEAAAWVAGFGNASSSNDLLSPSPGYGVGLGHDSTAGASGSTLASGVRYYPETSLDPLPCWTEEAAFTPIQYTVALQGSSGPTPPTPPSGGNRMGGDRAIRKPPR